MKRTMKSIFGVTLLEIMLVLAIAAMVIVMSVRYYQTATASENVNSVMEQVQAISAAADGLAQGSGSYAAPGVTSNNISPLLPANGLTMPWGTTISFGAPTSTSYLVTLNGVPPSECGLLQSKFAANTHYSAGACQPAPAVTNLTIAYTSTSG